MASTYTDHWLKRVHRLGKVRTKPVSCWPLPQVGLGAACEGEQPGSASAGA